MKNEQETLPPFRRPPVRSWGGFARTCLARCRIPGFHFHPAWLWLLNLGVVGIAVAWLLIDPRFEASVQWWRFERGLVSGDQGVIRDMGDWWWLGCRNRTVLALGGVAAISMSLMFVGLGLGRIENRTLRAWFITTAMAALWLGVLLNWQDIAWLGKQNRLHRILSQFDVIALDLQNQWPRHDGERENIGPFMAYPVSRPATLILLTLPEFENTTTSFSAIEGGGKILRFELVGAERGDWIEWHPDNSVPSNFLSGLGGVYRLERYQNLGEHWYLVRYQ